MLCWVIHVESMNLGFKSKLMNSVFARIRYAVEPFVEPFVGSHVESIEDGASKQPLCSQTIHNIWKKCNERPSVGGVSIRSRSGAPSRERRVVHGQRTKASNK